MPEGDVTSQAIGERNYYHVICSLWGVKCGFVKTIDESAKCRPYVVCILGLLGHPMCISFVVLNDRVGPNRAVGKKMHH